MRIEYKGLVFDEPLRFDVLAEDCLLLELKCVQEVLPIHQAQLLSYMKLLDIPLGLIINFHELKLTDGVVGPSYEVYEGTEMTMPSAYAAIKGGIIGIGFGGNKSGTFGVGVDLNYVFTSASDVTVLNIGKAIAENGTLKSQSLDIPVYGRFNIGGHNTKNAPTFYIPVGWFFDILLKSDVGGVDVMDAFNGFSTGPLVGAGFEYQHYRERERGEAARAQVLLALRIAGSKLQFGVVGF